jgi:SAM-dependent MidA family methyltransferase
VDLATQLRQRIAAAGPISVADYVGAANATYYAGRDPFGVAGDFVTAPEISQMFGELVGLWLADMWLRAGRPTGVAYVELGPGRGTLAADALRAMRGAGLVPPVHLVETSPDEGPLLVVANEFFDALPLRQLVLAADGWRELVVGLDAEGGFVRQAGPVAGPPSRAPAGAPLGTIVEEHPDAAPIVQALARRLAACGGAAIIFDYGHDPSGTGDTLQAVSRHAFADPWREPGTRDLTAHVDFAALAAAAEAAGVRSFGPVGQGAWLRAMGIDLRAASLAKAAPERTEEIVAARERLSGPEQMGQLFRVLALAGRDWPVPEGFAR